MNRRVMSALVENRSGVLSGVSGLFSRSGFNIDGLTVGETGNPAVSRMTIAATGDEQVLDRKIKQPEKLADVIGVRELDPASCFGKRLIFIKASADESVRPAVIEIASIFCCRIVDISPSCIIIEATGDSEKLEGLLLLLRTHGIIEQARTGLTAIECGSSILNISI